MNWTKIGLKHDTCVTINIDGLPGLNWTKIGLKHLTGLSVSVPVIGLNWTKIGLKPSYNTSYPA